MYLMSNACPVNCCACDCARLWLGVAQVNYPGLPSSPLLSEARKYFRRGLYGGMLNFGVRGGFNAGRKFINSVKLAR